MHDIERTWHAVHVSDENAKPMLGKFSGVSVVILLASVVIGVIALFILTGDFELSLLPAVALAGVIPASTIAVLLCLVVGKPTYYALRWFQHHKLIFKKQSLLTEFHSNEK